MKKIKHTFYPRLRMAATVYLVMGSLMGAAIAQNNYEPQLAAIIDVEGQPVDVQVGDVTGDGIDDVVMINHGFTTTASTNHIVVFPFGEGGAYMPRITFEYTDVMSRERSLQLLNVDDDDALEIVAGVERTLVIADYNASGNSFDLQTMNTIRRNDRLAAIDVNLDGQQDLVAVQTEDQRMAVTYLTNGSGSLQVYGGMDLSNQGEDFELAVADVTGDGLDDLLVVDGRGTASNIKLWVFEHDGLNDFAQPVGYAVGSVFDFVGLDHIHTGDFNADGLTDVVLTQNGGGPMYLLTQHQNGWLNPYSELNLPNRWAMSVADVDGNGEDDIVTADNSTLFTPATLSLTFQENGVLSNAQTVSLPLNMAFRPEAIALADINGDDCTDIVIADELQGFVLYRGLNCQGYADLKLTGRARGDTTFIVTLDNLESNTPIEQGEASVHIFVESPLHQLLGQDVIQFDEKFFPEECTLTRLDLSAYEIECDPETLQSGQTTKWGFRYLLLHNAIDNSIQVTGTLETNRPDPNPDNNSFQLLMGRR